MAIIDKPSDYFNTKLYTGTGSSNAVTGVGFQSDLLWFKNRNSALNHILFDSVRGIDKYFYVNLNEAEGTSATILTAVGSDGFTVGANNNVNQSSNGIVAWNWKAGGTASSNTDGSITSTVSANTTSGFSIVSYTGTGSNATVGHGLGSAPSVVFVKERSVIRDWRVFHKSLAIDNFLYLNDTSASTLGATQFNSTAPTSSVFSVGTSVGTNESGETFIAYCFAEKKGYSKFGSYTGNGNADGTFIYTGFKPAWIMIKKSSGTENWGIYDTKRNVNGTANTLPIQADNSGAESGNTGKNLDILSNGIKIKTANGELNTSGGTYIYMAFAENPFVSSTGVPATAR